MVAEAVSIGKLAYGGKCVGRFITFPVGHRAWLFDLYTCTVGCHVSSQWVQYCDLEVTCTGVRTGVHTVYLLQYLVQSIAGGERFRLRCVRLAGSLDEQQEEGRKEGRGTTRERQGNDKELVTKTRNKYRHGGEEMGVEAGHFIVTQLGREERQFC